MLPRLTKPKSWPSSSYPPFLKVYTYAAAILLWIEFIRWPKLRYPSPRHNLRATPVFLPLQEYFLKIWIMVTLQIKRRYSILWIDLGNYQTPCSSVNTMCYALQNLDIHHELENAAEASISGKKVTVSAPSFWLRINRELRKMATAQGQEFRSNGIMVAISPF